MNSCAQQNNRYYKSMISNETLQYILISPYTFQLHENQDVNF